MELGLRVLALVIDLALALGSGQLLAYGLSAAIAGADAPVIAMTLWPVVVAANFLWPVVFLAVPTGLWGRTVGKLLLRLSVVDLDGAPPGIPRALARETLKMLSLGLGIVALVCLYQAMYTDSVWYDHACRTHVKSSPWVSLSQTQKDFRKALREHGSRRTR
jgi:uncharacterized RDD family membrane protein YckC